MMEFLFIVLLAMGGATIGWHLREWHAKRVVGHLHRQMHDVIAKRMVFVEIEQHDGVFFVRNAETGEFLAQGKTHEEITDILGKRFPDTFFTASPDNLKKVGYKNDSI